MISSLRIMFFWIWALCMMNNIIAASFEHYSLPSLESCNYGSEHRNKAIHDNQSCAIVVIAFNRPAYCAQLISSLEKNPESQSFPFYFFLDGGPHAKQNEIIELIDASSLKNKTIIVRKKNYGCPKNHIDAKRFIFDWCGFSKAIILEEDLVVTPSFIHVNLVLHKWAKKNFSNVGAVQTWSYCRLRKGEKRKKLSLVEDSKSTWWSFVGYCIDKEVWNSIRRILYTYEGFVDQIPLSDEFNLQRSKPGKSLMAEPIRQWARELMSERKSMLEIPGKRLFKNSIDLNIERTISSTFEPNQDIMTGFALWIVGYTKIRTLVNRALHIGEEGISTDKEIFKERYESIKLNNFCKKDRKIHKFTVVG